MNRLQDKTILVTGAARGIGLAMARSFLREGGRVVLGDINVDLLGESVRTLDAGDRALGIALDITDIAKDGDSLVLSFERIGGRGQAFPIVLTLTLDGEMINANQDTGGGRFIVSGSGKKQ